MISKKMEAAINEQINREFSSAFIYLAMSVFSSNEGLNGIAHWFKVQYEEETGHAMKFIKYLNEQSARVTLKKLDAPPASFKSVCVAFEQTYKHERFITRSIHDLMDLAVREKDYATQGLLQWYVNEQVEEEAHAKEILDRLVMIGNSPQGMLMLDHKLGERK